MASIDDLIDIPVNADADTILNYSEQILNRFNSQQKNNISNINDDSLS